MLKDKRAKLKESKLTNLPIVGSIISAIVASLCCIGPVVLAILGVGGAGLFSKFSEFRPYLIGLTVILLGLAFYLTYRKRDLSVKMELVKLRVQASGIKLPYGVHNISFFLLGISLSELI